MPNTSAIGNAVRKPFTANKRLFTLLTVAFIVIGLFFAVYYSHIKNNEHNFRQSKLQSLDSKFDIITKQLNNDFQKWYSTSTVDSLPPDQGTSATLDVENTNDGESNPTRTPKEIRDSVWQSLKKGDNAPIFDQEFDEYIIIFYDISTHGKTRADSIIELSSLKGRIVLPDSLDKHNPFNIGLSMGIPEKDNEYQLFGREYKYRTELDEDVSYGVTLFGLVETERYNETIRKLDPWIITLLTTFLLLSLFGMPYFKLLFIAEDERLSSNDVILSGISILVGAPILMTVFLSLMNHSNDYYQKVPGQLDQLGEEIKTRFEKENRATVKSLYNMKLNETANDTLGNLPGYKTSQNEQLREHLKFVSKIDEYGKSYYHIAWINKDDIKQTKNLGNRPYFKAFKDSINIWYTPIGEKDVKYVMRPVVSVEDQSEEAVYILENKADDIKGYRVGASQLKSILNPILPFGFQFAIVDEFGEVWFHSQKRRATLENFFAVSRNSDKLTAAISGRIRANGLVNYHDEGKLFNVSPISNTNLSVITLYDIGLLRARVSEVLILSCIALVMAFLLMLIISVLSLIIRNPKLGLYKYDRFLFEFLTPKKENRDAYMLLSILFLGLLVIGALVGTCLELKPTNIYLLCLLLALYSYLIVFYTLHPYRNREDLKFRVRDMLLLLAIAFLNLIIYQVNDNPWGPIAAIIVQVVGICIIIYNQLSERRKSRINYRKQLRYFAEKIREICKKKSDRLHIGHRYWYAIFLFNWLLLATVLPSYLIFHNAKTINDRIWLKTDQLFMARKFMAKEKELVKNLVSFDDTKTEFSALYDLHLEDGLYQDFLGNQDNMDIETIDKESDTPYLDEFLWNIRPVYDNRINKFQALVYPNAGDGSWTSIRKSATLALTYLDKKGAVVMGRSTSEKDRKTVGDKPRNDLGFRIGGITGFVLLLAVLFSLILFFTDRIFAFRFKHLRPNDFDKNLRKGYTRKFADIIYDENSNSGLLLIGPPFTGKRTFAKEILQTARYKKTATLSMLQLDNVNADTDISTILTLLSGLSQKASTQFHWYDYEAFIIEHLEHNIKSFEANHIKLMVILFLISKNKRIILVSEIYPSQIFSMYENTHNDSSLPWGSLEDDFNSWRNILGAFPQVLLGITENTAKVYHKLDIRPDKKQTQSQRALAPLIDELGHSKFLPTLAPIIRSKTTYMHENNVVERLDRQRMVMHTQNLAHGYYNDIWNTLPTRERYMLYDLAKDGFLNIKNRNSLFSLMKKGLIVWNDRPSIFNYSFKNFIMTSVSLNEALRLENKNRGKGTWANTRILLYLIIITAIIFIALGKPELLKEFEALVGTLGGLGVIIPIISKILASRGQQL